MKVGNNQKSLGTTANLKVFCFFFPLSPPVLMKSSSLLQEPLYSFSLSNLYSCWLLTVSQQVLICLWINCMTKLIYFSMIFFPSKIILPHATNFCITLQTCTPFQVVVSYSYFCISLWIDEIYYQKILNI